MSHNVFLTSVTEYLKLQRFTIDTYTIKVIRLECTINITLLARAIGNA